MTKEEQQKRAESLDYIVLHKVTDTVIVRHKDGTEIYAVDVIRKPLVRCKDCRYWRNTDAEKIPTASIMCGHMHPDDFCSYGERKTDE